MDYDRLLNLTTDLGYQLMASGAEIYRVEESMHRVLNAYGLGAAGGVCHPNCIIVSVTTPQGILSPGCGASRGHGTDIELAGAVQRPVPASMQPGPTTGGCPELGLRPGERVLPPTRPIRY